MGYGKLESVGNALSLGSPVTVATASGTAVTLASNIPAGAQRITLNFNRVSSTPTSLDNWLVQLGTSGGFATSGYLSQSNLSRVQVLLARTFVSSIAGFIIQTRDDANTTNGVMTLINCDPDTFVWNATMQWGVGGLSGGFIFFGNATGTITLASALTRIRLLTINGTDTFDNGSVGVTVE